MARISPPWRALRPALLAGAAAVTWMTLSSTAATADAGADSSSLLGGVTSTVTSVTQNLASPAQATPVDSPTGAAGLLQPVVAQASDLADDLIASVPVANQVVPEGAVSTVTAPVTGGADSLASDVVQIVVAPISDALPALEPVVQPVSDLVTGTDALPVQLPDLPAVVGTPALPAPDLPAAAGASPGAAGADTAAPGIALDSHATAAGAPVLDSPLQAGTQGAEFLATTAAAESAAPASAVNEPLTADHSPLPAPAPPAPGSGTGTGGSGAGPSGAAAWLDSFDYDFHFAATVRGLEDPEHAPAPVSFDPGSSPD